MTHRRRVGNARRFLNELGLTMKADNSPKRRRKNLRLAWILVGFALFMLLSSIPFWKGLFEIAVTGAL